MALIDLSFVDEIAVTDAITAELITFEPQLSDAVSVADAIAVVADYARELSDAVSVVDSIEAELSQVPGESHRELADSIAVTDSIEALLIDGNILTITSVTPERGRPGDTITIRGTGFSPTSNQVEVNSVNATILSQSATEIVITQPTTVLVTDGFVLLRVDSIDTLRFAEVPFWIQDTIANLEVKVLPDQVPGPQEFAASSPAAGGTGAVVSDPTRAEARMWQRAATLVDFLLRDTLLALGDLFVRDTTGLAALSATGEARGQRLVADSAAAEGVRWGHAFDGEFPYGRQIPAATVTAVNMISNGVNTTASSADDEWVPPLPSIIDACYVYQHSTPGNTDRLDRVRILVNGSSVFDSGTGLAVAHRARFFAGNLSIAVAAGGRIQLEGTKTGTSETMSLLGAVRIQST